MSNESASHLGTRMAGEVLRGELCGGAAWRTFQREKVPLGIAFCRQRGLSLQDAEELVQRFSLHFLLKEIPKFEPGRAKILSRMYRYLDHRIIEEGRKKKRNPTLRAVSLDEPAGKEGGPRHGIIPGTGEHPIAAIEPQDLPPLDEVVAWLTAQGRERDAAIFAAVGEGEKQKDVAAKHGIQPSRISQILGELEALVRTQGPWRKS